MLNHYKFDFVCPMVYGGFCDNYRLAINENFCVNLLSPYIFVVNEVCTLFHILTQVGLVTRNSPVHPQNS